MVSWISLNKKKQNKLLSVREPDTAAEEVSSVPQTLKQPNTCRFRYGNGLVVYVDKAVKEGPEVLFRSVLNCQRR